MLYGCILLAAILIWLIYEWIEHTLVEYNTTEVESQKLNENETLKVCLITDLHNNKKNTKKLTDRIREFSPDLVLLAGDMVNKHDKNQTQALAFLRELAKLSTVYYSMGNHEERMRQENKISWENFRNRLPDNVKLLDNTMAKESLRTREVCISGLSLPEVFYCKGKLWNKKEDLPVLKEKPEGFHIMLAHNPEYMNLYAQYRPDVVLSGHLHGGLLRLPFVGGVISPRLQKPKEDAGVYRYSFGMLFVSRGLGSHTIPLRFFNRAEINFLILRGENQKENGEK